jgi:hypothetical protein
MTDISIFHFAILALASYRLTGVVVEDVILNRVRSLIWKKFPPENEGIGYIITCVKCTSIWTSALLVLLYTIDQGTAIVIGSILAVSAVVRLLTALVDH